MKALQETGRPHAGRDYRTRRSWLKGVQTGPPLISCGSPPVNRCAFTLTVKTPQRAELQIGPHRLSFRPRNATIDLMIQHGRSLPKRFACSKLKQIETGK